MNEYIERKKALDEMHIWCDLCGSGIEAILAVPTEDVSPVVHGQWVEEKHTLTCSACGYIFSRLHPRNFCPNCGAKMDSHRYDDKQNLLFASMEDIIDAAE